MEPCGATCAAIATLFSRPRKAFSARHRLEFCPSPQFRNYRNAIRICLNRASLSRIDSSALSQNRVYTRRSSVVRNSDVCAVSYVGNGGRAPFYGRFLPVCARLPVPSRNHSARPRRFSSADDDSPPEAHLRLDTSRVTIPVQATRLDAPVLNLSPENFRVFENGNEQRIRYFTQEDAPHLDWHSARFQRQHEEQEQEGQRSRGGLLPYGECRRRVLPTKFDEDPRLKMPFTSDTAELTREIRSTRPFGSTLLYDAVHMALDFMKRARYPRKALVILSDGGDNRSRRNLSSVKSRAAESGIPIYSLGIFERLGKNDQDNDGSQVLDTLASLTGGRHFPVEMTDTTRTTELLGRLFRDTTNICSDITPQMTRETEPIAASLWRLMRQTASSHCRTVMDILRA